MAAYTWLNEQEFERFSSVEDKDINFVLKEVRSVLPEWYISSHTETIKSFWPWIKDREEVFYSVYQRQSSPAGELLAEVRVQMSASRRPEVLNLLYGLYMGYHCSTKK